MSELIIKNQQLTITISTKGAEIQSVRTADGTELLWCGDPNVWGWHAPVLFPIVGGLKNDTYRYNGIDYTMKRHGFGRTSEYQVECATDTSATFLLCDNEQTRAQYPFSFAFRITYTLEGDSLKVAYQVDNAGEDTMYFFSGSHEAYACPNGIEEYSVIFDKPEDLYAHVIEGGIITRKMVPIPTEGQELKLTYDLFKVDAQVFPDTNSDAVTLLHRPSGRKIRVEFPGCSHLLLWTKPGANYICIEPWHGLSEFEGNSVELDKKDGVLSLKAGETWSAEHTITF